MNAIINMNTQATMSHIEIAKIAQKRSDNVKTKMEELVNAGAIQLPEIQEVQNQEGKRSVTRQAYMLNKLDSITLMASINPLFCAALVARWDELEKGVQAIAQATTMEEVQEILSPLQKRISHIQELNKKGSYIGKSVSLALREMMDEPVSMIEALSTISQSIPTVNGGREKFWQATRRTVEVLREEYRKEAKQFDTRIYSDYEQVLHYCTKRIAQVRAKVK